MTDRDFITSIRDQCNAQLGAAPPVDPGPVNPQPPVTQPPTNAIVAWANLGGPGEQSPTDNRKFLYPNTNYSLTFTKTSNDNTVRFNASAPWFTSVVNSMPGISGETDSTYAAGFANLNIAGAPMGPVTVVFRIIPVPGQTGGDIAPQVF